MGVTRYSSNFFNKMPNILALLLFSLYVKSARFEGFYIFWPNSVDTQFYFPLRLLSNVWVTCGSNELGTLILNPVMFQLNYLFHYP